MNVSYTAVIFIKQIGDDEWGGLDWWWDDIESDGDQYDFTFSLQRGCYFINASLYESGDLNSDVENATVLAGADLDFVVGTGTCVDGVYSEEIEVSEGDQGSCEGTDTDCDDPVEEGIPGFGVILSITAVLGAALIATRRE
jgi:PGF-CTERM protein